MSTKLMSWLAALAACIVCVSTADAQQHSLFTPFDAPPVTTDFQFFAPRDLDTYGGGPNLRTGWFLAYDRLYMNVSRPDDQEILRPFELPPPQNLANDKMGDFTWGTRFDIGFVNEEYDGWTFTAMHVDGPGVNETRIVERINRFNSTIPDDPERDENNRTTGARDYILRNSINVANLDSVELNKTWMWKPLHNGGTLEPFIGFRYVKFLNYHRRASYVRFDANGIPIPPTAPAVTQLTAITEDFTQVNSNFQNDLVGGQLGIRWSKPYRAWKFYGDVKFFGFQNFQYLDQFTETERTVYAAIGEDAAVNTVLFSNSSGGSNGGEFVWGGDMRAEAAYELTRDIAVRMGFEMMYFGQGIARGDRIGANEEDLLLFGLSFGATLNR